MTISFTNTLKTWKDGAGWHYVRLPKDCYKDLKEIGSSGKRGLGAVKVKCFIGNTEWETSVFPDSEDKSHILFIKKAVRTAENITAGDRVKGVVEVI